MSYVNPPTKPPRGVKHAKETSGLLMSVISTLSASETNEQRDRERSKLETEYKRCDRKLDELISTHDQDLGKVMQLFTTLSTVVNNSREKIHAVKESIHTCKTLLGCRRDELLKLWLEGVEHKHMLQLLEEIEQMNEVPVKLTGYLQKKHYLHATKLLVNAMTLGKSTLDGVEGLRELAMELENKKKQLHVKLLEELTRVLYLKSSQEAFELRRQGSGRDPALLASPFQREAELRASSRRKNDSKVKRSLLDVGSTDSRFGGKSESKPYEIIESLQGSPEADSNHFMAILVECLALLEKIPEAVEKLVNDIQSELKAIIKRTSKEILDMNSTSNPQMNLLELLETIFVQFRHVSKAHECLLKHLNRAVKHYKIDVRLYEKSTFWMELQKVLQTVLASYLDIKKIAVDELQNKSYSEAPEDISNYFLRRKNQPRKKGSLFTFDTTSFGLSSYLNETLTAQGITIENNQLVCSPDPNLITIIFIPVMKFVNEIENVVGTSFHSSLSLKRFINNYVTDVYLTRIKNKINSEIEIAVRNPTAWKIVITHNQMCELQVLKPLLQSAITVGNCINEWRTLMDALPPHTSKIGQAALVALTSYRDICSEAYQSQVQPDERRICSAAWLKDEDISRFLKSLPNWTNLKAHRVLSKKMDHMEEESPADIKQRNVREADILISNLGEGGIQASEIISEMNSLKCLAQLQESMEWFSDIVESFNMKLKSEPNVSDFDDPDSSKDIETTVKLLNQISQDFDDLADTCLLLLHLEVRVQCFHYLLTQTEILNGSDLMTSRSAISQEPDLKVQQLTKILTAMDEAMNSSLQPHKCKYIFEGLGHLISKILISSSQFMDQINEAGIERMLRNVFALQQTLTNITMSREVALDHARHYFELFYLSPEDILATVMEKGPEFSELDYMNAFQLLSRSKNGTNGVPVNVHLEKLSDILGEIGVTV